MVYSLIKAIALLFAAVSAVNASDAQNDGGLRDMDVDYAHRELWEWGSGFSWNWNILMFNLKIFDCNCDGPLCRNMCVPPSHGPMKGRIPEHVMNKCGCTYSEETGWVSADYQEGEEAADGSASSKSGNTGSKVQGTASRSSNWWMYVAGAAMVGLIGGAIVMRKRRNAAEEDELNPDASISGAVSKRAALLAGGGAAAAATLPKFLTVPSFRKKSSGLEVGPDGQIIEQSPSSYMDMDNHVDSDQLPEGVEISQSGNLEPYHPMAPPPGGAMV